jgi:hypothetical protein
MYQMSLEVAQAGNIGPLPMAAQLSAILIALSDLGANRLQDARSINQDIARIGDDSVLGLDLEIPFRRRLVPDGQDYPRVELHILVEIPFGCRLPDILPDLGATGIELGPFGIGFKRKCIDMSWNLVS